MDETEALQEVSPLFKYLITYAVTPQRQYIFTLTWFRWPAPALAGCTRIAPPRLFVVKSTSFTGHRELFVRPSLV
jgi:hypothetical protein